MYSCTYLSAALLHLQPRHLQAARCLRTAARRKCAAGLVVLLQLPPSLLLLLLHNWLPEQLLALRHQLLPFVCPCSTETQE